MTIDIATNVGSILVEAKIFGPPAFHQILFEPDRYSVTHVATGLSVTIQWTSTELEARWLAHARKQAVAEIIASRAFGEAA